MPLNSPCYLPRHADLKFTGALCDGESIVLIRGPRQMGKTSLLARGLDTLRAVGAAVVHTDLLTFDAAQLATANSLLLAMAREICDQLALSRLPESSWDENRSPNRNLERYLRDVALRETESRLVWAFDSIDSLSGREYSNSVFGLFRSWHNRRALDPGGPWERLSLVLVYSMEAHLLMTDRHQSPLNVGVEVEVTDFSVEQVAALNALYGSPLKTQQEVERYSALLGGHPYLSALGLTVMCTTQVDLTRIVTTADTDEGIFGRHLRQVVADVRRDPELTSTIRSLLRGISSCPTHDFYRLRSAGILTGASAATPAFRCPVYRSYLSRHLL